MTRWLVVDSNYLCHRALHTTGHLMHDEMFVGVTYGFLRDVVDMKDQHTADGIAFCFDSRTSLRKQLYPQYKANRVIDESDQEEVLRRQSFYEEVNNLRRIHLPTVGYKNVLCRKGYEADDLIASITDHLRPNDTAVVVSADKDLFQCLCSRVSIWNPTLKKLTTAQSFKDKWGVLPSQWPKAKAFAGCTTDNIKGIEGIGEATACKWLRGELKETSKAHAKILGGMKLFTTNLPLVKLPFEGLAPIGLVQDEVSDVAWRKLTASMGMSSLSTKTPGTTKPRMGSKRYGERS